MGGGSSSPVITEKQMSMKEPKSFLHRDPPDTVRLG